MIVGATQKNPEIGSDGEADEQAAAPDDERAPVAVHQPALLGGRPGVEQYHRQRGDEPGEGTHFRLEDEHFDRVQRDDDVHRFDEFAEVHPARVDVVAGSDLVEHVLGNPIEEEPEDVPETARVEPEEGAAHDDHEQPDDAEHLRGETVEDEGDVVGVAPDVVLVRLLFSERVEHAGRGAREEALVLAGVTACGARGTACGRAVTAIVGRLDRIEPVEDGLCLFPVVVVHRLPGVLERLVLAHTVEDLHRHVVDVLDRERLEVDVLVGVGPSNVVRSRIDRLLEHVDRVAKQDYEPDGGADQETDRDLTGETVRVRHRLESEGPAGAQPRRERRVDGLAEVAETALVDGDGDRGRDDGEHAAELEETPLDVVGSRPRISPRRADERW